MAAVLGVMGNQEMFMQGTQRESRRGKGNKNRKQEEDTGNGRLMLFCEMTGHEVQF